MDCNHTNTITRTVRYGLNGRYEGAETDCKDCGKPLMWQGEDELRIERLEEENAALRKHIQTLETTLAELRGPHIAME